MRNDWAARIPDKTQLASWATGPYFPYPYLNITGHVKVGTSIFDCVLSRLSAGCPSSWLSMGDSNGQKVRNFFTSWKLVINLVCPSTQVAVRDPCNVLMASVMCAQVAVPDPIPLDPARDVPLDTLGSTWIVAAGPSALGQPDYRGAPQIPQHPNFIFVP